MNHYHSGIDYFTPLAGTTEKMLCVACEELLDAQRDVAATHGRWGLPHKNEQPRVDIFSCRFVDQDWHTQIVALLREIKRTASHKLTQLLESEITEIRHSRKPTKEIYSVI